MRRVLVLVLAAFALLLVWFLTRVDPPAEHAAPEIRAPASPSTSGAAPETLLEDVEPSRLPGTLERGPDPRSPAAAAQAAEPGLEADLASRAAATEDLLSKYRGVAAADRAEARRAIEARIASLGPGSAAEARRLRIEADWLAEHPDP